MSGWLILLIAASVIVLFVDLVILLAHNVDKYTKFSFTVICAALVFWQITVFISENVTTRLIFWNSVVFIGPTTALAGLYFFASALIPLTTLQKKSGSKREDILICRLQFTTAFVQLRQRLCLRNIPRCTANPRSDGYYKIATRL